MDQNCKATLSIYEQNFQTVASKLLETKLEVSENMQTDDILEGKERVQTRLLHLESTREEHALIDDTIIPSDDYKKVPHDTATPKLHEIEPCVPLSNLPEEYCDEFKESSVEKVNI